MTLENGAKVIAFDFDGVLHEYRGWNHGALREPIPGMYDLVLVLQQTGAHVVVHTTRDEQAVHGWLRQWGFPDLDVYNTKWTRIDVFVDDRALRFDPSLVRDRVDAFASELLTFQPHWREPEGALRPALERFLDEVGGGNCKCHSFLKRCLACRAHELLVRVRRGA